MTITPDPRVARLAAANDHVVTYAELRRAGVHESVISNRCRAGGPWQRVLPRTYVLQPGRPTPLQRMRSAVRYAEHGGPPGSAQLTGAAALALRRLRNAPRPEHVREVDVLVARGRDARTMGYARVRPTRRMPVPLRVEGLPCAPLARAVADAVRDADARDVRGLLAEVVQRRRCTWSS